MWTGCECEALSNTPFKADAEQLARFDGNFHRQFLQHLLTGAVDDRGHGVFSREPPLLTVEDLVVADLRYRRFMLNSRGGVLDFKVWKCVGAAFVADQKRVALRVVTSIFSALQNLHHSAIRILSVAGRNSFRNDRAPGVLADVDHLCAGIGLLIIVGYRNGVERAGRVISHQNAAGIFPGDRRSGFDLRPGNLRIHTLALPALCDEVVNPAAAFIVAGIPVLNGGVTDLGVFESNQLDHGSMELIAVTHRRGTAFEIADVAAFVGNDERAFKLSGFTCVDTEVGGKLQRTPDALWDVGKRTIAENSGIQGRKEIVAVRHD